MIKKLIFLFFFFYFLALLQVSFLPYFSIRGIVPNWLLLAVLWISFLESPQEIDGIASAIYAGFFWDVFSIGPIGFHILILLFLVLLVKLALKKYVRVPAIKTFPA